MLKATIIAIGAAAAAIKGYQWYEDSTRSVNSILNLSQNATTLRDAAEGTGIYVGTAVNQRYLDDDTYSQMAAKEFNLITPENGCKMNFIAINFTHSDFTRCK